MATTPPCRFWPRARPRPADCGATCATIARSAARPGQERSSSIPATAGGEHPGRHLAGYTGILQADAYAGFNDLYVPGRKPGPIVEAACWAHGRRKLFVLADLAKAPLAIEAVRRIDAIFAIERDIKGLSAVRRHAVRQVRVAPLVTALEQWMRSERAKLSAMPTWPRRWITC
jgi:hypothetical protein